METVVIGHKNPDSDSTISAIALSYLYNQLGYTTQAYTQGEVAPETIFILEKSSLDKPSILHDVTGREVILVDFSDKPQAPHGIDKATILAIIDHHKLGDLTTDTPLEMWVRPVGCSSTIVKMMYDYHNIAIPPQIAQAMLCAILSDTVLFKSVTTTQADIQAVSELATIASIENPLSLGMEMFIAKSNVQNASAKELLFRDYKDFTINGQTIGVGQLETVDLALLEDKKEALLDIMQSVKEAEQKHTILLLLTDIMKEGSLVLFLSDEKERLSKVFNKEFTTNALWIDGMMSRKKQVMPYLQKMFDE